MSAAKSSKAGSPKAKSRETTRTLSVLGRLRVILASKESGLLVRYGIREVYRSRIPQMAAALSYRTIFALIPSLVLALLMIKAFTSDEDLRHLFRMTVRYSGLSSIVVPEEPALPGGAPEVSGPPVPGSNQGSAPDGTGVPVLPSSVLTSPGPMSSGPTPGSSGASGAGETEGATPEGPEVSQGASPDSEAVRLEDWISDRLDQISRIPFRAIGGVGLALFVYAAMSMLIEVERALNSIVGAQVGRRWLWRLTLYWTMLTMSGVLLVSSFYVGQRFQSFVEAVSTSDFPGARVLVSIAGYLLTVAISALLLLFTYTTMPTARVGVRYALTGAIFAAILWEAGKWLFTSYFVFSPNYVLIYGSVAIVPLTLLWIYFTWVAVLVGYQMAVGLSRFSVWRESVLEAEGPSDAQVDPGEMLLIIAGAIAGGFQDGKPVSATRIAEHASLRPKDVSRVLNLLKCRGVIHQVEGAEESEEFALALPPGSVSLREVLEHMLPPVPSEVPGRVRETVQENRRRRLEALGELTMSDLVAGQGAGPGAGRAADRAKDGSGFGESKGGSRAQDEDCEPGAGPAPRPSPA